MTSVAPRVFMSYSHDDEEHADWVLKLATRLRGNGVDVCLDRWDVTLGGNLSLFMERAASDDYRVIAVVSENYTRKCDDRSGGAGVEAQMLSSRLYSQMGTNASNAIIPILRNNPQAELPAFLSGQLWEDFRNDSIEESAYERLLRNIHGVPVDAVPPLGTNPFEGRTSVEATLAIRNSPSRWHNPAFHGDVEFVCSQNSGHYKIGSGDSQFTLDIDWLGLSGLRIYRDPADIAHVAAFNKMREHTELLADVSQFETSNRVVYANVGDAFVLHNHKGFWALVYIDKLYQRQGPLNREDIVEFRYAIQPNRKPDLSDFAFPGSASTT
ncbi:toll/interleukin-1 receptor domain-containing protein [Mycobacterium sp. DL440]|uniref:toll/interleukin-1 receptor domain-containing protein n=1 Tax=Mycobacterium sp. DL440 TaxID=2675523 RepID=UPI0014205760|nr:toll/interleukin-1 receptor domain-containing protein [Mycobacterium sp. DL440]